MSEAGPALVVLMARQLGTSPEDVIGETMAFIKGLEFGHYSPEYAQALLKKLDGEGYLNMSDEIFDAFIEKMPMEAMA